MAETHTERLKKELLETKEADEKLKKDRLKAKRLKAKQRLREELNDIAPQEKDQRNSEASDNESESSH